ncbi:MAG: metal-dependent hydrolase [Deltaproteobacteria bacterium]
MDNITHTLTGLALANAGLNRKTRFATAALVIGSNLPDLDILWSGGGAKYLEYHRGITHSILGAAVLAVLLAAAFCFLGKRASPPRKQTPPLNARWMLLVCLIALGGHVLMDFTNAYGVRLFLPFDAHWYAWDIMFIIDPLLLAILIGGIAVPALFRLISEEVGASKPGFRLGAIVSLVLMVLLWGLRDVAHRRVVEQLDSHVYGGENPVRIGAFPTPANPLDWIGVVETGTAYRIIPASALDSDVDLEHPKTFFKPDPTPALDAAEKSRVGGIFLDFARFPWANVAETDKGYDVTIRDLRFYSPNEKAAGFVSDIVLDKDLHVVSATFGFAARKRTTFD